MHGWRARIALIIAHSNTTIEPEFNRLAPDGVSIHVGRVPIGTISAQGLSTDDQYIDGAAKLLSDINARVIGYACNGANVVAGPDGELEEARRISGIAGATAVMASAALLEAFAALKIKRVAFAVPYPPDLADSNDAYWKSCGIEVVRTQGVNLGGAREPAEPLSSAPVSKVGLQTPEFSYNLARMAYDARAEAVVVPGCNLRTIEVAAQFESDFGIPFLSSNLALFWALLQAAGIREPIAGYGKLLQEQPPLGWVRIPRYQRK
jgi:maleate isomerase